MSNQNASDARFAHLFDELNDNHKAPGFVPMPPAEPNEPSASEEWDDAPQTTPNAVIQDVADLYKGRFKGYSSLAEVESAIPELAGVVTKEHLYTVDGACMPRAYGTVRTLPDGSRQGLGVVGDRYNVVQDSEAFKIMQPLLDNGTVSTLTAGVYMAKSWLYGEGGSFQADIVPGDTIEARVLIGNSHDGSIPWSFGFPGNRVVCQNTFHMALSSKLSKLLKVRHTRNAAELVAQVQAAVEAFGYEFVTEVDKMQALAKAPCTETQLKEYTGYVFSKWADDSEDNEEAKESRVYAKVLQNFEGGQGAQYHRGTLWGAYNAVTEYVSHQRSRGEESADRRFVDLNWGNGAQITKRALERAVELV